MFRQPTRSDPAAQARRGATHRPADPEARERTVGSMVSASLLAVLGTLMFAWALRSPEYPWLFAVGALPWLAGVVMFGRAVWRYTHL
jgi:hypothetical protein